MRAGASPTWSEPEGSSHNESHLGRYQSLTQALFAPQIVRTLAVAACSDESESTPIPEKRLPMGNPKTTRKVTHG